MHRRPSGSPIIDETLAQQYWPNEDPLGTTIVLLPGVAHATIVGIVGHTKESDLASGTERGRPLLFLLPAAHSLCHADRPDCRDPRRNDQGHAGSRQFGRSRAAALRRQDAWKSASPRRWPAGDSRLCCWDSSPCTAVFLAALGLYGVINYGVTQRTQEIGIRMVLGARRAQVLSLIVGQGCGSRCRARARMDARHSSIARLLPNQLFGVSAFDPATFAGDGDAAGAPSHSLPATFPRAAPCSSTRWKPAATNRARLPAGFKRWRAKIQACES